MNDAPAWQRIDSHSIPPDRDEIRAFLVVRNEALRLPSTLRHHRNLGVDRFFIIDNGSTDGTLDLLAGQADVHVFRTTESYASSHYGVHWTNTILDAFGDGHWALIVDSDEQFIYPHFEELELPLFCRYLDYVDAQAVFCLLLDMYSNRSIAKTVHDPDAALIDTCRYFDLGDYRTVPIPVAPHLEIYGGVRERVFQQVGAEFHAPTVSKVPLVRWRKGMRFLHSTHALSPVTTSNVTGVLLHFKFLSDFHDRVETEVARGEHFAGGREYRAYRDLMRQQRAVNFFTTQSMRFESSAQLVRLGLMRSEGAFEQSVCMTRAARACQQNVVLPDTAVG